MAYGTNKDLPRREAFDKVLHNKTFEIAINPQHDRYERRLTSMVYKFFDKKLKGITAHTETGVISEDQ